MAETTPGPITEADALSALPWIEAALRGLISAWNKPEATPAIAFLSGEIHAVKEAINVKSLDELWTLIAKSPEELERRLEASPFEMVAWIISNVTGLTISGGQVQAVADGPLTADKRRALGQILTDMYGETLQTGPAAAGWAARNPGDAEYENFRQLSGAAMRIQVGDLLIGWLGKAIPYGIGGILSDVAEKINEAIALDDALEEVVQVPMQAVIQRGLEAKYNRELLPGDYTNGEARQAFIAGIIDQATLDKILDNSGVRKDIRPTLLDFAAANLTESDINDLYQHNLFDRDQVKDQYRQKYFQEEERELKTKLVEGTRRWKLEEKVFELYGNLYRDGVATKEECRPHLEHFGYDPDEIEMWFQVQELERRQRKWLPVAKVNTLAKTLQWTAQQAVDYLVLQGMTPEDAANDLNLDNTPLSRVDVLRLVSQGGMSATEGKQRLMLLGYSLADSIELLGDAILEHAVSRVPKKIRDEYQAEHKYAGLLQAALATVIELDPTYPLRHKDFLAEAQRLLEGLLRDGL